MRQRVTMRAVGFVAAGLLPIGMLALATGPTGLALTILFVLCWGMGDGLLTIVRTAGAAEILGRQGFGTVSGALSAVSVVPRTAGKLKDVAVVRRVTATRALPQIGRPEDIANAVVYLSSDALARHVTGETMVVAGGMEGRLLWGPNEIDPKLV